MKIIKNISNEGTPTRSLQDVKMVVLHHTGSTAPSKNILTFLKRKDYINVHYVVLPNGEINQTVDENHIAWHAGVSSWKGLKTKWNSLNWCSIGIEVHSGGHYFRDEQRASVIELVSDLIIRYNLKPEMILRHKDIAPKRKWDIGDSFWNDKYFNWKGYQQSFNKPKTMTDSEKKTTEALVGVLSALWSKLSVEGKKIAEKSAEDFRNLL